jgi:hypothetical protein
LKVTDRKGKFLIALFMQEFFTNLLSLDTSRTAKEVSLSPCSLFPSMTKNVMFQNKKEPNAVKCISFFDVPRFEPAAVTLMGRSAHKYISGPWSPIKSSLCGSGSKIHSLSA